jgi:hypothetical protein
MADPVVPPAAPESAVYRPLSGFALAGFILSALYAVFVLANAALALMQGIPFFFPFWVAALALAGLTLSLLGQAQIRNSEGTRAGLALARTGIWLSIFAGLGYFAYYYVTGLAVTSQANSFLLVADSPNSGFFPRLEKGATDPVELRTAYLFTLPANQRGGVKAEDARGMAQVHDQPTKDGGPGKLSSFERSLVVRTFGKGAAGKITVEPLGVQAWGYEFQSYRVARNYRVRTPELEMEILVPTGTTEGDAAGQMREWYVAFNQLQAEPNKRKFTPLGLGLQELRKQAAGHVYAVFQKLNSGKKVDAFRPSDTNWDRVVPAADQRAAVRKFFTDVAEGRERLEAAQPALLHDGVGDWEFTKEGQVLLQHRLPMRLSVRGDFPGGVFDLLVETQTRKAVDPVSPPPNIDWDVVSVRLDRAAIGESNPGPGGGTKRPGR